MILSKLGKWKYSLNQLAQQILNDLMEKIKPRWEHAMETTKDIYEQTLRQLMPSLSNKEVNESKQNEEKLTLKFNTCLILMNDIEHVVRNATNTWKNNFNLQKQSDFVVHVSNKDEDDGEHEKKEETNDEEIIHYDNIDDEENEHGQESTKEDLPKVQNIEETDLKKIAAMVIASPPHSLSEALKTLIDCDKHCTYKHLIKFCTYLAQYFIDRSDKHFIY